MTRRIDIELTSSRDDGTWTGRAPGARQPRGSLEGTLLPSGAKVGDILRAEAEFDLDGIMVTSVQSPRDDARPEKVARIEIIGSGRDSAPGGVSVVLVPGSRRRDEDGGARPRRTGQGRGAGPRRNGTEGPPAGDERGAARTGRPGREARPPRSERAAPGQGRTGRPERAERPERGERPRRLQTVSTHRNAALAELRP